MARAYLSSKDLQLGDLDDEGARRYGKPSTVPGRAVFELQEDLHSLGFLLPKPDGAFGERTRSAVKGFQQSASLSADGLVGPKTKQALASKVGGTGTAVPDQRRTYDFIKRTIESRGHIFESGPGRLNLLGIRGYWRGQSVTNAFDGYNDTIYAAWVDARTGEPRIETFDASCDPGTVTKDINELGVAHLVEGQWFFLRGKHRKTYRALQQSRPVKVMRYFDAQPDKMDPTPHEGMFGINIHAAGKGTVVGDWSAGCQVIHGGVDGPAWLRFDRLVWTETDPAQQEIPYTLVKSDMLPSWT